MNIALVIPAYNPDENLLSLIKGLSSFARILIVNDGSTINIDIFNKLKFDKNVIILSHAINMGKGAALKTAMNYIYCNLPEVEGIVTADADGQHLITDIKKAAELLKNNEFVLGERDLKNDVPLRNFIGNLLTRKIFNFLSGLNVSDTQSGLRGIRRELIPDLLRIRSNGYEFEMEMLLNTKKWDIKMKKFTIETIYLNGNKSSHFNPLIDSMKIYYVFLRFTFSSLLTALIDNIVFFLSFAVFSNILISTVLARLIALIVNYSLVKNLVFHSRDVYKTLPRYIFLVILMGSISYGLINYMNTILNINVFVAKIGAEIILYIANFAIQRDLVFRNNEK